MSKLLLIMISILLAGCVSQAPEPIVSPTIASKNTINPSTTRTQTETSATILASTRMPTNLKGATSTPNPNHIAKDFIYYYKEEFDFYKKKLNPPLDIELLRFEFEYDENGILDLYLETKSGELLLLDNWPLDYSLGQLCLMLDEENYKLPIGINSVVFLFKDNDLIVFQSASLSWEVISQYVGEDITFEDLYNSIVYK